VDRTFVSQMTYSPENLEIVRAIVRLAKNLGLTLVAEGVENQEQLAVLQELECDQGQGYLFGRPMTAEAAEALLHKGPGFWQEG
jgi:EAL domain-containing protein (putative c-di-GMP-specific phosphodiesterase class I)